LDAPNARIYQPQPNKIIRGRTFKIRIVMLSGLSVSRKYQFNPNASFR
jgi:hypothetical protein